MSQTSQPFKRKRCILVFKDEEEYESSNQFGLSLLKGFSLYPHQVDAIKWMLNIESEKNNHHGLCGGILALKMGLGKTLSMTSMCMIPDANKLPNLVVCSKTVAGEWIRDIKKFYGDSCRAFYFHRESTDEFDDISFETLIGYNIVITTYETVMKCAKKYDCSARQILYDHRGRKYGIRNSSKPNIQNAKTQKGGMLLFAIPWRRVIADESHRFSNPSTGTFYSMMCLYGENKWCLSGTPLRNYSSDIYAQLRFCGYTSSNVKEFNSEVYHHKGLKHHLLCKDYEDAGIVLPDITEHIITIRLEDEEKEIYDYYFNHTKKAYNGFLVGNSEFSNVLVSFLRLRQICVCPHTIIQERKDDDQFSYGQQILDNMTGGLVTWINDKNGTAGIGCAKMQKMVEILSKIQRGEKTLIFSSFKRVISMATQTLDKYLPDRKYLYIDGDVTGRGRENILERFKSEDNDYDILFISYKVGSEGLNLVEATNIIMFENWWTPVVEQQAKARAHRMGQTQVVNVWKLVIEDSIESNIEIICQKKTELIDQFVKTEPSKKTSSQTTLNSLMIRKILCQSRQTGTQ